jgi:hypothetical protein
MDNTLPRFKVTLYSVLYHGGMCKTHKYGKFYPGPNFCQDDGSTSGILSIFAGFMDEPGYLSRL